MRRSVTGESAMQAGLSTPPPAHARANWRWVALYGVEMTRAEYMMRAVR